MIDHEEIYRNQAEACDLLVSREDYRKQLLPALRRIRELAGLDVAELGAGSGRLTVLIAPLVDSLRAFDRSDHMLAFAARRSEQLGITNTILEVADNRNLPLQDGCVDLSPSGWSIGYFASPDNADWQGDVEQTLEEKWDFKRTWIRTDYRFESIQEAEQIIDFFFGEPLSGMVREQKLTIVPECTGIWWRQI